MRGRLLDVDDLTPWVVALIAALAPLLTVVLT